MKKVTFELADDIFAVSLITVGRAENGDLIMFSDMYGENDLQNGAVNNWREHNIRKSPTQEN